MSAVASRPFSVANSFYESDGRPSTEHAHLVESNNKTRGLVRAISRERDNLAPSFRPPSTWTQRSSHHDVVWNGDHDQDANDEQFSDAESWDGDAPSSSHAVNGAEFDATASVYGHVRPNSIASSIFAGRGAKSERRRREAAPPLPALPPSHHLLGSDAPALLGPSAQNMLSPWSDADGFESSSQYSDYDARTGAADHFKLADGFDIQNISSSKPSTRQSHYDQAADAVAQPVPSRNSSKTKPPLPAKAASRGSNESPRRDGSSSDADSPCRAVATSKPSPKRLPDGTLIPKMPPVPQSTDIARSLKPKARRDRSPILSFDGGVAEEEKLLGELQGKIADDARRISTLGPKVKKNAPAPWELGGDDTVTAHGRPSLRETLRPGAETFERPFSRFKTRPSVDGSQPAPRSPNPVHAPSGLAHAAASLESEAQKDDDIQSLFVSQRSRSKSVSGTAVGMLKGLGLAGAAAPASKKGKLSKALRLVGGGGGGGQLTSAPLSELSASAKLNQPGSSPIRASTFGSDLPHSHSTRQINSGATMQSESKSHANLVNMIMSSNTKFRDQACSPPLPSPKGATMPSPHLGGVRSLAYKKDPLSAADSASLASELNLNAMERARSRTPPMRQVSVASHSAISTEDTAVRNSSVGGEGTFDSFPAEGESTPVGKTSAETSSALRARPGSPSSHRAGIVSASSSQTSGSLPLPGNIEGVPYKLISLEEAREQARQKQSEWLASSGATGAARTSPYLTSGDATAYDELGMQRDASSDGQSSMRLLKNKKSGFLLRKLKKEKGVSVDFDGVSTFPTSGSNKDLARSSKASPMPSFSVTGLDEENDELKPLAPIEKPALQIRPVSSMFSGFAADFLDASALADGHAPEPSSSSSVGSTGLLVPHSPAGQSFLTPSPVLSESGRFASGSSFSSKPKLAEIRPPPHGAAVPGPTVPGSAESNWSGMGGASGASRMPSLDAGASTSDTQSQFHSPANSPLTPSFHHSVHAPASSSHNATTPLIEETAALSPPASPLIPEEVRQRAREIEAQIQELCNELTELRVKHVGQGTAPVFRPNSVAEDGEGRKEHGAAVGDCPACGCECAEQRRLQSINEAAVLKGISVLDRGRALKPSANMGSTGKFGGYTNR
ncbi:hypothetical protein EX895_004303 [Sporisorium graminicola]|uniref:Uncharacterized protein n=1 Tax=Sporisorium graminicola TaxID=280036 RepID=A0A4U7KQT0_9BASI|nr:hypothetical protein EX895_004303 [Sporisorium graminicola]TKY86663.1 hypothetical protein EX895_004303 [Sporisorium graminicola]